MVGTLARRPPGRLYPSKITRTRLASALGHCRFLEHSGLSNDASLHKTRLLSQVVFQTIHLIVALRDANDESFNRADSNAFKVEIFFRWLTESVFLVRHHSMASS